MRGRANKGQEKRGGDEKGSLCQNGVETQNFPCFSLFSTSHGFFEINLVHLEFFFLGKSDELSLVPKKSSKMPCFSSKTQMQSLQKAFEYCGTLHRQVQIPFSKQKLNENQINLSKFRLPNKFPFTSCLLIFVLFFHFIQITVFSLLFPFTCVNGNYIITFLHDK